jgi:tetratricopeptide (TPR) repeat protein
LFSSLAQGGGAGGSLSGLTLARTPLRFGRLVAVAFSIACVLALSSVPSQARLRFGTDDQLVKLQDVEIKGPQGEALYLGYKYSFHYFLLPYTVTTDGYVLGVRGQRTFFKLDEARIKSLQASGLLPSPLPPYKLSLFDLAIGHALWIVLFLILAPLFILKSIFQVLRANRRRKRAIPHFEGAVAEHRAGNLDAAIDGYTRAIEADDKLAIAFHARGKAFEAKDDGRNALSDYTKAIRIEPKSAQALWDRGTLLRNMEQFETAVADFTRVVKLSKDAAAHVQRGYIYLLKGDLDRAIADFTTAIKRAPDSADAYHYRAVAYERKGKAALAQADHAKANAMVGDHGAVGQRPAHAS